MPTCSSRRLGVHIQLSLDGYYCDAQGHWGFAHKHPDDHEWNDYVSGNASSGGALLFGRITYEMMASWWPTPMAAQAMPVVAAQMNALPKYVCSRTMGHADWANTTLLSGDAVEALRRVKAEPGPDITILGSGELIRHLTAAGLIDSWQIVFCPVALGAGRSLFAGLATPHGFRLEHARQFGNGSMVVTYRPTVS